MKLEKIVSYLDGIFADYQCDDFSNNGLQVEASEEVTKVAFAVDGCQQSIDAAAEEGAQLLVVHHGISWGNGYKRIVGSDAKRFEAMYKKGVSLYGMHLPLDAHAVYGNNAVIAERIGLKNKDACFEVRGLKIGVMGTLPRCKNITEVMRALVDNGITGKISVFDNTAGKVSRIGIVSGSGGDLVDVCQTNKIDCLITGEISHADFHAAKEHGVTVLACGHYATEVWGVRSLMPLVASRKLQTVFIDIPTSL